MKIVLSGGGTAGHVNPALAIAGHFKKEKNADILFIGTQKGIESRLVPEAGYKIEYITVQGLIRSLSVKNLIVLKNFIKAIFDAKKMLRAFHPDVVIGTGGYVCAPVLYAAKMLKIPTLIHEQNVIPGVTVKMAASIADSICISFSDTKNFLKPSLLNKCTLTGNPIREEMLHVEKEEAKKKLGLDSRPFIVAFGGSLGAQNLNRAAIDFLNENDCSSFQFMLGTGKRYYEEVVSAVSKKDANIFIREYIHNMDLVMSAADVVVGRAGALTVSELAALGKPSVLIPSPNVAHDHQTHNAKSMEQAGAALFIADCELSGERLKKALFEIIENPGKAEEMSQNAFRIAICDGAKRIYDAALQLL